MSLALDSSSSRTRRVGASLARIAVLPVLVLALWHWLSQRDASYQYAFVPLAEIGRGFVDLWTTGELVLNIVASLATTLKGLAAGAVVGVMVGVSTATLRPLEILLMPLIQAARQVPTLALIPLIGLWFGNSEFSKLLLVSMAVFEVMVLNTYEAVKHTDPRQIDVANALLLSRWQILRRVRMPAALPAMVTGLQQGIAFAWLATVGAELLFTVGPGVSSVMERAQAGGRMDLVIVCLTLIASLGYAMQGLWRFAGRRLLRWRKTGYAF